MHKENISKKFMTLFLIEFTKEIIKHSNTGEISQLKEIIKEKEDKTNKSENISQEKGIYFHNIKGEEKEIVEDKKQIITTRRFNFPSKEKKEMSKNENLRFLTSFLKKPQQNNRILAQIENKKIHNVNTQTSIEPQKRILNSLNSENKDIKNIQKFKTLTPLHLRVSEPKLPQRLMYLKPIPTNIEIDLGKLNPLIKDPFIDIIECGKEDTNIIVSGKMGDNKKTEIILTKEEINEIINKFSKIAKIPINEGLYRVVVGKLILNAIISSVISSKFIIKKLRYPAVPIIPKPIR